MTTVIPPYDERDQQAAAAAIMQWREQTIKGPVSSTEALLREVAGAIATARAEGHGKDLRDFIEAEQINLWHDLDHSIRLSANGVWSMGAAGFAMRAAYAARLVGPSHGGVLPWGLHSGGVIDAVLRVAGIEPVSYSAERWAKWEESMGQDYGTIAENCARYARTVSAIENDRQLALDLQP